MPHSFRQILVPFDFSRPAARALRLAAELLPAGGRLSVLHVIELPPPAPDAPSWTPTASDVAKVEAHLRRVTSNALGRAAAAVDCRVTVGDPFRAIMRASRGTDAIVMATTGRSGLARLVIGSVAEKVVRHSAVPVLTVRARSRPSRRGYAR